MQNKCRTPEGIRLFHTPFRKQLNDFVDIRFCFHDFSVEKSTSFILCDFG